MKTITWISFIIIPVFTMGLLNAHGNNDAAQKYVMLSFRNKLSSSELIDFARKIEKEHDVKITTLIQQWGEHKGWYHIPDGVSLYESLNRFNLSYRNFLASRINRLNNSTRSSMLILDDRNSIHRQVEEYNRNGLLLSHVVLAVPEELSDVLFDYPEIYQQRCLSCEVNQEAADAIITESKPLPHRDTWSPNTGVTKISIPSNKNEIGYIYSQFYWTDVSGFYAFNNSAYEHEIRAMTYDLIDYGPFWSTNLPGVPDEVYYDTRCLDDQQKDGRAFGAGTIKAMDLVPLASYYIYFDIKIDNENSLSSEFRTYSQLSYKNPYVPCIPSLAYCVFSAGYPVFGVPGFEDSDDTYFIQHLGKENPIGHGDTVTQYWSPDLKAYDIWSVDGLDNLSIDVESTIYLDIRNLGHGKSPATSGKLLFDGQSVLTFDIPEMYSKGEYYDTHTQAVPFPAGYTTPGTHTIELIVDSNNSVNELETAGDAGGENNNSLEKSSVWQTSYPPDKPTLKSPDNGSNVPGEQISFSWYRIKGATDVKLQVATSSNFGSNDLIYDSWLGGAYTGVNNIGPFPDNGSQYWWRVKGTNYVGEGWWSDTYTFTNGPSAAPAKPTLTSPGNNTNAAGEYISLSWNAIKRATDVKLQVSKSSGFSSGDLIFDEWLGRAYTGVSDLGAFPDNGSQYWWRVKGKNSLGEGSWSDTWTFINGPSAAPEKPILASPGNNTNAAGEYISLSWNAIKRATDVKLQVSKSSGFSSGDLIFDEWLGGAYIGVSDLGTFPDNGSQYWWRVRGKNSLGEGSWSDMWTFINGPSATPAKPILTSPGNGVNQAGEVISFYWERIKRAADVKLQIATSSNFISGDLIFDEWLGGAYTGVNDLGTFPDNGSQYWWKVKGENSLGEGDWSDTWTFINGTRKAPVIRIEPNSVSYERSVGSISSFSAAAVSPPNLQLNAPYVPGEVLVKFREGTFTGNPTVKNGIVITSSISINEIFSKLQIGSMEKVIKTRGPLVNTYKLHYAQGQPLDMVIKQLLTVPSVEWAEPNYLYHTYTLPDDYNPTQKWELAKVRADEAWEIETGSSDIVIAVIDTGVDYDHPDLASNIWHNSDEIPNNVVDDDGNGFVDDNIGWDFVSVTSGGYPGEDMGPRDNDPIDFDGHGTHCSGIVGATGNNGFGTIGVAWNCRIMSVRAGYKNSEGGGSLASDDIAAALHYAADNGANIISMSFGGSSSSNTIQSAVSYALNRGCVLVAAAGNDGSTLEYYPATYDGVIAVAASMSDDSRVSFSNYGSWVDVAAPGYNIYSTMFNDTYAYMSGTSMACPLVAGVAGLILSQNPLLNVDEVTHRLISTAIDVGWALRIDAREALANTIFNTIFTVYNDGNAVLSVTNIELQNSSAWLSLTPTSFTVAPGGEKNVSAQLNLSGIDVGTYSDRILVYSNDDTNSPYSDGVYVTLKLTNRAPEIQSITAEPNPVDSDKTSTITVIATDPDNHSLSYEWSVTGGSIVGSGNIVTYHPPAVSSQTMYTVTAIVSDGYGGSDTSSIDIIVNPTCIDNVELRTVVVRNDKSVGGEFHLDLEIRITSGTSPRTLNSLTADIYYGTELNEWSGDPSTGWAFSLLDGYSRSAPKNSGYYRILVTGDNVNANGKTSLLGDPPGWDVTDSWKKIVTLRWTIAQATSVTISVSDDMGAAAYFNYQNVPQGGVTGWAASNQDLGDISLPVSLVALTATTTVDGVNIKWRTETEVGNIGFGIYRSQSRDGNYTKIAFVDGAGNSAMPKDYQFTDEEVKEGQTYFYYLEDVDITGSKSKTEIIKVVVPIAKLPIPSNFALLQNYPNPFNPETWIPFQLAQDELVTIRIYNTKGQLIRTLYIGDKKAGIYISKDRAAHWDGKDGLGQEAASGVYYYTLQIKDFKTTRKMVILK